MATDTQTTVSISFLRKSNIVSKGSKKVGNPHEVANLDEDLELTRVVTIECSNEDLEAGGHNQDSTVMKKSTKAQPTTETTSNPHRRVDAPKGKAKALNSPDSNRFLRVKSPIPRLASPLSRLTKTPIQRVNSPVRKVPSFRDIKEHLFRSPVHGGTSHLNTTPTLRRNGREAAPAYCHHKYEDYKHWMMEEHLGKD